MNGNEIVDEVEGGRESWGRLPGTGAVLDELRAAGVGLRDEWIGDVSVTTALSDGGTDAWHVAVRYDSPVRPRTRRYTIVQCVEGGLDHGEGWAVCRRWTVPAVVGGHELAVLGQLLAVGAVPRLTFEREL